MKKIYLPLMVGLFLVPTVLISQTYSISGQITRHNGDPVSDIEVSCDGTVITDVEGNYEFTDVPLNYNCELSANGTPDKFEDVTILDRVVIQLYILYINPDLGGYQLLACDLNNSQSISGFDLVRMTQLALRIENNIDYDWIIVDEDHVFDMSLPFSDIPTTINIDVTDSITDVDFIAIKSGDPAISSDYFPAPPNAPSPTFTISNEMFQAGDDVQFDVTVDDFSNIAGFQQTFKWDPNILEYESVSSSTGLDILVNDTELSQGLLPSLTLMNFNNLDDGEVAFTLHFKALADISNSMEVLSFSDDITARQVVWANPTDQELFIVEGEYINGEGSTGIGTEPSALESFEISPNPIGEILNVKALLQDAENFEINVTNVLGQNVYSEIFSQKELLLHIDFSKIPSGTYFLSLKTADGIRTESFVKN